MSFLSLVDSSQNTFVDPNIFKSKKFKMKAYSKGFGFINLNDIVAVTRARHKLAKTEMTDTYLTANRKINTDPKMKPVF